jgi:hypothetical protein
VTRQFIRIYVVSLSREKSLLSFYLSTICSFEFWYQIWYNMGVNNSDLLNGHGGWLFMCGTFL